MVEDLYSLYQGSFGLYDKSKLVVKDYILSSHVQSQSSHLEDELLIALGVLSLKGFPVKNSYVQFCG